MLAQILQPFLLSQVIAASQTSKGATGANEIVLAFMNIPNSNAALTNDPATPNQKGNPEVTPIKVVAETQLSLQQELRAQLAIAAALNSTLVYMPEYIRRPEAIRDVLLIQMDDYFAFENVESSQFDRDTTLAYVQQIELEHLVRILDEMGKNPFSQISGPVYIVPDDEPVQLWIHFIDTTMEQLNKLGE